MAVHHGKEGEVVVGGSAVGELTSFTLETQEMLLNLHKCQMVLKVS